jgi:hypothetical protein
MVDATMPYTILSIASRRLSKILSY